MALKCQVKRKKKKLKLKQRLEWYSKVMSLRVENYSVLMSKNYKKIYNYIT
jgi:hypothetical protein